MPPAVSELRNAADPLPAVAVEGLRAGVIFQKAMFLDLRDVRPLTSKEMARILVNILKGVAASHPASVRQFPRAVATARSVLSGPLQCSFDELLESMAEVGARFDAELPEGAWCVPFVFTVSGFTTWCQHGDVDAAVSYLEQNLGAMFKLPS